MFLVISNDNVLFPTCYRLQSMFYDLSYVWRWKIPLPRFSWLQNKLYMEDLLEIRITSAHFCWFYRSARFTNFDINDEHCLGQQSNLECLAFSMCFFFVELCFYQGIFAVKWMNSVPASPCLGPLLTTPFYPEFTWKRYNLRAWCRSYFMRVKENVSSGLHSLCTLCFVDFVI